MLSRFLIKPKRVSHFKSGFSFPFTFQDSISSEKLYFSENFTFMFFKILDILKHIEEKDTGKNQFLVDVLV